MPKELNFFDTNPVCYYFLYNTLGISREKMPIWDKRLLFFFVYRSASQPSTARKLLLLLELPLLLFE